MWTCVNFPDLQSSFGSCSYVSHASNHWPPITCGAMKRPVGPRFGQSWLRTFVAYMSMPTSERRNVAPLKRMPGLRLGFGADVTFALQMQDDLLGGFVGRDLGGVDRDFGVGRSLVGIGNAGELLDDAGAGLGVQSLAVAAFADLQSASRYVPAGTRRLLRPSCALPCARCRKARSERKSRYRRSWCSRRPQSRCGGC